MNALPPGLLGLLLAACLLGPARAATPPPEQGPAAPWEAAAAPGVAGDLAKPVLNELVSGPQAPQAPQAPLVPPLEQAVKAAETVPQPIGAPGDSHSTTPQHAAAESKSVQPTERAAAERGPRLVSTEQDANSLATRPRTHRQEAVGGDAEDAGADGVPAGGMTKRPRPRLSVRRGLKPNATAASLAAAPTRVTPAAPAAPLAPAGPLAPAAPAPPAPQPPTKEADWKPSAVEDNTLLTTEPPVPAAAAMPGPPPPTVATAPRPATKEAGEMMELSSVSPLQRSRLSTLRWRHPDKDEGPTEPPRRLRHRETPWEGPSTTHRTHTSRGSVRFGSGAGAATSTSSTSTTSTSTTGATPTRSLDEDMRVPETAYAWSLAAMRPPGAAVPEEAPQGVGPSLTTESPPIVIEVSTLPDVTPAHAHAIHTVHARPEVASRQPDKMSNMMVDAEPRLPLESVFSTRPVPRPPSRPPLPATPATLATPTTLAAATTPAANNTGENLVVQPMDVVVEPSRAPMRTSSPTPPSPAHIAHNAVQPVEEDEEDEDEPTNPSNIHVVDPPDLATPAIAAAPAASAAPSSTSSTSTTSGRPDLWRPVQPVQPAVPTPGSPAGPGMVEYFTIAPSAGAPSSPSGAGTASASGSATGGSAPTAEASPSGGAPGTGGTGADQDLDDDVVPSPAAPTPAPEDMPLSTLAPDDAAEEEEREEDAALGPVSATTATRRRPTTTPAAPSTEDDEPVDMSTRSPPAATVTPEDVAPPEDVAGNTTAAPPAAETTAASVETSAVTAASPAPTTRTAPPPPPPTLVPTVPATPPASPSTPETTASPTEASPTTVSPQPPVSTPAMPVPTPVPTSSASSPTTLPPTSPPTPTPSVEEVHEGGEIVTTSDEDTWSPTPEEPVSEVTPTPTPEPPPAYLRVLMETEWGSFCQEVEAFKDAAAFLMANGSGIKVHSSQVVLLNTGVSCSEGADEARAEDATTTELPEASAKPKVIIIQMYIADSALHFSRNLTEDFLRFWGCKGLDYPIRKVDLVMQPLLGADGGSGPGSGAGVIAAIAISCVAAACLLVLAALLLIMRKRQKSLSYGQRCTPVSLDAYSLDSVSVCNSSSVRRKGAGARASKRSYGNPAFADPAAPSHPLTFPALSNVSSDRGAVEAEFANIPQVAPKADELPAGADTRNRYANVIPLPETRVTLSCKDGDPLSQYINANYVRGPKNADKFYIACQAPLAATVHDFWRMVWETQAKVILMLTDLVEDGVEKCADYLPPSEVTDCHRLFGDFQVTLKKREVKDKYVVSSIQLKNMETNLWREATHMWYMGWPSRGVPDDPSTIIAFLIEARAFMRNPSPGKAVPHVVHCSPGTGRTGTVLAIDLCIREFETTRQVDIPRTVYRLRKDRAGCVQTKEQYMFVYKALNLYATKLTGGALDSI